MSKKVVVITGASSGIGATLARQLGPKGYQLVLAARRQAELEKVAAESGAEAIAVVCDVTVRQQVENLRDRALETFKQVDVWINNAGQGITRPVLELTDEDFDWTMNLNLRSALYGMQAIVPYFKERGQGHLINVSSFLGRVPLVSFRSAYSAAKAALNMLTASLRMDLATTHPNIHISLVMPGVVSTEFGKKARGGLPKGFSGGAAPNAQTADQVAAAIESLIENPVPEIYTNPALADVCRRYYSDVAAFERAALHRS
jgi:short-subunit dehydrogenase